ncbi:MAG: hypothetical protein Kow002_18400 [Anaerolineales bacterium]
MGLPYVPDKAGKEMPMDFSALPACSVIRKIVQAAVPCLAIKLLR